MLPDHLLTAASRSANWSVYREAFPISITQRTMERGQERFNIYCATCHDRVGTGRGMIVERGFTTPPSLHTDWSRGFKLKGADLKLTDAPVGYYFDVITLGYGAMPDYSEQIAPDDRWAIIAYIRALQLSQRAPLKHAQEQP
jgi:mono/diheme cytochrome c family protein